MSDDSESIDILKELRGGQELLDWFDGEPVFGDSEVVEIRLVRNNPSWLRIALFKRDIENRWQSVIATFALKHQIDLSIEGFSHQNVIGGLAIRRVPRDSAAHASLLGIGLTAPTHEIFLEPCAGSFGSIRAAIEAIILEY